MNEFLVWLANKCNIIDLPRTYTQQWQLGFPISSLKWLCTIVAFHSTQLLFHNQLCITDLGRSDRLVSESVFLIRIPFSIHLSDLTQSDFLSTFICSTESLSPPTQSIFHASIPSTTQTLPLSCCTSSFVKLFFSSIIHLYMKLSPDVKKNVLIDCIFPVCLLCQPAI